MFIRITLAIGFILIVASVTLVELGSCQGIDRSKRANQEDTQFEVKVNGLVAKLQANDFAAREQAEAELVRIGRSALPALRSNLQIPDLETRTRIRRIIRAIGVASLAARNRILPELAKRGELNRLIEQMVEAGEIADDQSWNATDGLCSLLLKEASGVAGKPCNTPECVKAGVPQCGAINAADYVVRSRLLARSVRSGNYIESSFVVCSGSVDDGGYLKNCVVLTNGDVHVSGWAQNCLIVCDGKVDIDGYALDCVILCRGSVGIGNWITGCVVEAKSVVLSKASNGYSQKNTYINVDKTTIPPLGVLGSHDRQKNADSSLLGLLQFTDPADWGVEAEDTPEGMKLTRVLEGTSSARAGLKAGDMIVSMDDIKIETRSNLLRALRLANEGDRPVVTLRRGNDVIQVQVWVPPER